jgi:oligoribonuclease (3'-5' exoribonuclease)
MTGLDPDSDMLIEIFCIITDGNLNVLDEEGWGVVVHQSKETMDKMVPPVTSSYKAKLIKIGRMVHENTW